MTWPPVPQTPGSHTSQKASGFIHPEAILSDHNWFQLAFLLRPQGYLLPRLLHCWQLEPDFGLKSFVVGFDCAGAVGLVSGLWGQKDVGSSVSSATH